TRVIEPSMSFSASGFPDFVIINSETSAFGHGCQAIPPSLTNVPIGRSWPATSTCSTSTFGASAMGLGAAFGVRRNTYVAPNARIAIAPTMISLRFMNHDLRALTRHLHDLDIVI